MEFPSDLVRLPLLHDGTNDADPDGLFLRGAAFLPGVYALLGVETIVERHERLAKILDDLTEDQDDEGMVGY